MRQARFHLSRAVLESLLGLPELSIVWVQSETSPSSGTDIVVSVCHSTLPESDEGTLGPWCNPKIAKTVEGKTVLLDWNITPDPIAADPELTAKLRDK